MTAAVIVGCNGQDGRLLFDYLDAKGYQLTGIARDEIRGVCPPLLQDINICNSDQIDRLLQILQPDEIYYLAAFHHSSEDVPLGNAKLYRHSHEIHVEGLLNFLEGAKRHAPASRLFYAASSHVFGHALESPQDEMTPINPNSPYGITKANGYFLVRNYRELHGLFACSGILYNHESTLRAQCFVTQKIITTAIKIKYGLCSELILGDLAAIVDWGYAPDYVEAMHSILAADYPDDYVISTGIPHTVQEFVQITFELLGLDWRKYVHEDKKIIGRKSARLVGNSDKLRKTTKWQPSVDLKQMIYKLIEAKGGFNE